MSEISIQGKIRNPQFRMESSAITTGNVLKSVQWLGHGITDAIPRPGSMGKKHKEVCYFLLEIVDGSANKTTVFSAEMKKKKINGRIREHDEVIVTGHINNRTNRLIVRHIESLRTGEIIY